MSMSQAYNNSLRAQSQQLLGCRQLKFHQVFGELMNSHWPDVVVLLETRLSFSLMVNFFTSLNLSKEAYVDPVGRSGGI